MSDNSCPGIIRTSYVGYFSTPNDQSLIADTDKTIVYCCMFKKAVKVNKNSRFQNSNRVVLQLRFVFSPF